MNAELKLLAKEYMDKVNKACLILLKGLDLKTKQDLISHRNIAQVGEFEINGINHYMFHGIGCRFSSQDFKIDWDFGFAFGSKWCGIDPWKLADFIKANNKILIDFNDGSVIEKEFEQAVIHGEMVKKGFCYYFTIPSEEIYQPNFPKEFDTLIIYYYDSQWIIKRSKLVDRFIRKSKRVWKHTGEGADVYILSYFLNGRKVYSIPYEDIGYEERAVTIMEVLLKENVKVLK